MSKVPLTESNVNIAKATTPSKKTPPSKRHDLSASKSLEVGFRDDGPSVAEKSKSALNIDAKENDLAVEINITTGSNVQVKLHFLRVFRRFVEFESSIAIGIMV